MFWVSFTCKKRGRFVPRCRLRNRSSRWAVVFLTDHRHFVHFLKAEFQPTSAASARWLRSKTCPICITSAPNNSPGRRWVNTPLRNSQDPLSIGALSKPPWQMWFCTTIRAQLKCYRILQNTSPWHALWKWEFKWTCFDGAALLQLPAQPLPFKLVWLCTF